ncbi:MAG: regulatory protein GemA [Oxalobacter sp.]|jgi:phage gp16-like protein|nr:MAG: regulatory protein GemA [Oxalobacter sp.]
MEHDAKRLVRLIQIARREIGMAEDAYRATIRQISRSRTDSSTGLTVPELEKLLAHMKRCGFKVRGGRNTGATAHGARVMADDPQSRKIRALWLDLHAAGVIRDPSEAALNSFVRRMTGIAALQWLSSAQASRVIEEIKKWSKRTTTA